jgi:hypothetical protein
MNAGTQTARSAPLSLVAANEDQTQNAGFSADFQDLCSRAMDQALGIEKASLSTVVTLNSCLLDIYQEALRVNPVFGNLFDMVYQAVACSMELQMNWLTLVAPHASSVVASDVGGKSHPKAKADVLERSMDIALGMRKAA